MEHVVEVTAKRRLLCHVSHADIQTKNGIVWTAVRHRAECHPYLKKSKLIVVGGWLIYTYLVSTINEDGTRMRKKNMRYSYMAGSRQHLICPCMRACLRCLNSGRHGRATVCICCCCYHGVAVLRLVVVLLLLLPLCTKKLNIRTYT